LDKFEAFYNRTVILERHQILDFMGDLPQKVEDILWNSSLTPILKYKRFLKNKNKK
jgi:hypothetical protein